MTSFAKRRTRPVRHQERNARRGVPRILRYIGVAVGFAAIGYIASLAGGGTSTAPTTQFTALAGRPSAIALTRGAAYVADDQAGSVLVLDPSSARVRGAPVRVGANPISLAVGDGSLFVGHASGDLTRVDLASHRVFRVHVGGSITGLAFDGHHVWAADLGQSELEEMNPRSLRVLRRVRGVAAVRVIAINGSVWATTANDEVVRYDGAIRRVRVGAGPIGLAGDGRNIWAAVSDAGWIVRIDARSMRVTARVRVGHGPVNLAVLHGVVWVTNNDDRTLSRIDARSARDIGQPIAVASNLRGVDVSDRLWFVGTDPSGIVRSGE